MDSGHPMSGGLPKGESLPNKGRNFPKGRSLAGVGHTVVGLF